MARKIKFMPVIAIKHHNDNVYSLFMQAVFLFFACNKLTFCEIYPYILDKYGNFIGICAHLMVYYPLSKD